jgi:hypothetical protein
MQNNLSKSQNKINEMGAFSVSSIASNLVNSNLWSGKPPNIILSENNNKNPDNPNNSNNNRQ